MLQLKDINLIKQREHNVNKVMLTVCLNELKKNRRNNIKKLKTENKMRGILKNVCNRTGSWNERLSSSID